MGELFDKKFVHFMWDDELEGKECFFADNIKDLKECVENGRYIRIVFNSRDECAPFGKESNRAIRFKFCYYDPLYYVKRAYYVEGKTIQCFDVAGDGKWDDVGCEPSWKLLPGNYRVKPCERVTCMELAKWLAEGNGQFKFTNSTRCSSTFAYPIGKDDEEVCDNVLVRKWNDGEWHKPTAEYIGEEKCESRS